MTTTSRITRVADGQEHWYADEAALRAYLSEHWDRSGRYQDIEHWSEPETSDYDSFGVTGGAYTELCEHIPDMGERPWHSTFDWEEARGTWRLDLDDAGTPDD